MLDDFISRKEKARWEGHPPPEITVTYTIRNEIGGKRSKFRLEKCTVVLEDAGMFEGNAKVVQKLAGKASTRVKA